MAVNTPTPTPTTTPRNTRSRDLSPRALTAITAGAVLLGVVARFLPRGDLWLDEALSVHIAGLPLGDIGEALRRDGHPPLYYWLLHGWMAVFGTSDAAVRALSAVIGVAWIPLLWITARRVVPTAWHDRVTPAALTAAAVLPFGLRYGTETRMYSLVILLATALIWFLVEHIDRPRPVLLAGIAITTAALLWSHYWSIYLLAVVGAALLWRRAWAAATAMVVGGLAFLPWVPSFLYQAEHTGTPWGEVTRPTSNLVVALIDVSGGPISEAQILSYLLAGLMVLALVGHSLGSGGEEAAVDTAHRGIRLGLPVRPEGARLAVVGIGTLLLGSGTAILAGATFATRYIAVAYPFLVLLIALGAIVPATVWIRALVLTALVGAGLVGLAREYTLDRTQAGAVAEAVIAATPEDGPAPLVVVCPDQLGPATVRALEQRDARVQDVLPYPALGDPHFVDWVDYGERNAAADTAAIAEDLRSRAAGAPIHVVMNTGYRTFEGRCEALLAALAGGRAASPPLVTGDGTRYWEPMYLYEVPPA